MMYMSQGLLKLVFIRENSEDHDAMSYLVAFNLGLYCLPKFTRYVFSLQMVSLFFLSVVKNNNRITCVSSQD